MMSPPPLLVTAPLANLALETVVAGCKIGRMGQLVGFRPELQIELLAELDVANQAKVDVEEARTTNDVPSAGAEACGGDGGKGQGMT